MAWALKFDGVNDYALHGGFSIGANDDFSIKIKASSSSQAAHTRWLGGYSIDVTNPRVLYLANTGVVRLTFDGVVNREWAISLDATIHQEVEFRRVSGVLDLYVNDIKQAGGFSGDTNTFTNSKVIGGNYGVVTQEGNLEYIKIYINNVLISSYDATLSSHAAGTVVLKDVASGNDATGVGFPTDGSAWVDLGGGGTTYNLTVSVSASYDIYSSALNQLITSYDLYRSTTATVSTGYDLYNSIVNNIVANYDLYNSVTNNVATSYAVYNSTVSSVTANYDVYTSVISSVITNYDVYNSEIASISTSYATYNATVNSIYALYDININTTSVISSVTTNYDVYNAVVQTTSTSYDLYNSTSSSISVSYDLYNNANTAVDTRYDVYNATLANVATSYDVYNSALTQLSTNYDIYNTVSTTLVTSYSVYNSVLTAISASYDVYSKAVSRVIVTYDLGDVVADERLVAKMPFIVQNKRKSFSVANARKTFN